MAIRHLICCFGRESSKAPFQALASSPSLLRSSSSPALRLAQVPHSVHFRHTSPHHILPPSRYIEHSVRTQSRKCLPSRDQSQVKSMTSSLLVAAAEAQPVLYVSPVSTHVQALTASCVASRIALWREDCHHRRIRKTGWYLRKRWWVSLLWWSAHTHTHPAQAVCRRR
jgi:hypothetical protein